MIMVLGVVGSKFQHFFQVIFGPLGLYYDGKVKIGIGNKLGERCGVGI